MSAGLGEAAIGFLLLFVLPGFTVTKAVFPEWRIRGEDALLRATELGTLTLTVSAALVVLVGFGIENGTAAGFQATWSDPVLESALAVLAGVAFAIGWVRGAYRRAPPAAPPREPVPGEEGAWELLRELDGLRREERRLRHSLRTAGTAERPRLEERLAEVRAERARRTSAREEEYDR